MINPRRINQMYQAIEHGIPWQEMELEPPLSDEEIEFFEDVKREYDETVTEFGSCSLEPVELNWEDIPDIYHDDEGELRAMAAADEPRMTVGAIGRIDHGKTSLTAAIQSVISEQERAHTGSSPSTSTSTWTGSSPTSAGELRSSPGSRCATGRGNPRRRTT